MLRNSQSPHHQATFGSEQLNALADSIGADNMPVVLDQILELTPQICDELGIACAEGDMQAIASAAHKVKSNCAYLGATEIVAALTRLENLAMNKNEAEIEGAILGVVSQLDSFLQDVRLARQNWSG